MGALTEMLPCAEMVVLSQTGLTLIVAKGQGDNPIRATGAPLSHLEYICAHTDPGTPQVWFLKAKQKNHETAAHFLEQVAQKNGTTTTALITEHKIPGIR